MVNRKATGHEHLIAKPFYHLLFIRTNSRAKLFKTFSLRGSCVSRSAERVRTFTFIIWEGVAEGH